MGLNSKPYNGWVISHGDYVKKVDETSKRYEIILRRKKIFSTLTIIFGTLTAFILFLVIMHVISGM